MVKHIYINTYVLGEAIYVRTVLYIDKVFRRIYGSEKNEMKFIVMISFSPQARPSLVNHALPMKTGPSRKKL